MATISKKSVSVSPAVVAVAPAITEAVATVTKSDKSKPASAKATLTSDVANTAHMIPTPFKPYNGGPVVGVDAKDLKLVKPGVVFKIKPSALHIEQGYNVRDFNPDVNADDAELLASINAVSVRTPLRVRIEGDKAFIEQGHRRHAGVMIHNARDGATQILRIPVMLADPSDAAQRTMDVMLSNNGLALTPMQKGVVALKLQTFGWKVEEIARQAGMTPRTLTECIKLASADAGIRKIVRGYVDLNRVNEDTGKPLVVIASGTTAQKVLNSTGPDAAAVMAKAAEIVPTTGKLAGKITDAVTAKAVQEVSKAKGAPLVTAKGKASKGSSSPIAKGNATAAGAELPKPIGRPVAAAAMSDDVATLMGPFKVTSDSMVLDMGGSVICEAASLPIAKAIARAMNGEQAARNLAAKNVSGATPAAPRRGRPPGAKNVGGATA